MGEMSEETGVVRGQKKNRERGKELLNEEREC
jgi:hypothetical protein